MAIVQLEGLGQLKKKIHLIGTRTRELPARSMVPQLTTLPRTPTNIVWDPKIHCRVHKSSTDPNPEPHNPAHTTPNCFSKIHFNIIFPPTSRFPSGLVPSGFPTKNLYTFVFHPLVLHILN
jgi:hypothetical protein